MATQRPGYCSQHRTAKAGWICSSCGRELCPACCSRRKSGRGEIFVCDVCGELAHPILVPRPKAPFRELIAGIARYPFDNENWHTLLIAGCFFGVLRLAFAPGNGLADALTAAFLYRVIDSTSRGNKEIPEPADFSDVFDVVGGGFRGALGAALAILPLWIYVWLRYPVVPYPDEPLSRFPFLFTIFQLPKHLFDPISLLFVALGLVWAPLGIIAGAMGSPFGVIVNPLIAWRMLRIMGSHFLVVAAVFWSLAVVWGLLGWMAMNAFHNEFFDVIPLPLALIEPVRFGVATMAARSLGVLLYTHGADMGYGMANDYLVPVLGNVQPELVTPKFSEEAPLEQPVSPIELPTNLAGGTEFQPYQPPADAVSIDVPNLDREPLVRPVATVRVPAAKVQDTAEDLVSEEEFLNDMGMSVPKKE